MSKSEAELEFNPWDCGWAAGFFAQEWVRVLPHLERDLARPLAGWERVAVRRGYLAGTADRGQWAKDQAARDAAGVVNVWSEIPF